jgi:hypothetical protein
VCALVLSACAHSSSPTLSPRMVPLIADLSDDCSRDRRRCPASSKAETLAPATGGALIAFLALGDEKQNHAADGCGYGGHEPPIDTFAFEKLKAQQQRHQRIGGSWLCPSARPPFAASSSQ